MEHRFVCPKVWEITDGRSRPPAQPRRGRRSQRELVLASLLHRPEHGR